MSKLVVGIASQAAVLAAVLYYFGWARVQGSFAVFGLDPEIAGLSVTDYVLRSIRPTLGPVIVILAGTAALLCAHGTLIIPFLGRLRDVHAGPRWAIFSIRVFAGLVFTLAATGLIFQFPVGSRLALAFPIGLTVAVLAILYCDHLQARFHIPPVLRGEVRRDARLARIRRNVFCIACAAGLFWSAGVYALSSGQEAAESIESDLSSQPSVVLFSEQRLAISGTGVTVSEITQSDSKFKFQYNGLRLLIKAPGRYLLIPNQWRRGYDSVIIIPEDDAMRIDIRSAP